MASPLRSSGVASAVRNPKRAWSASVTGNSASSRAAASMTWIAWRSVTDLPLIEARLTGNISPSGDTENGP